jgi:hypothetical protein
MSHDNSGTVRHDVLNEAMALHTPKTALDEMPQEEAVEEAAATPVDVVTVATAE